MFDPAAGMLSSKKRSRQLKSPYEASQTEYVKIPSAVKRPCVGIMTDRQKEVLARQKAGMQQSSLYSWENCSKVYPACATSSECQHLTGFSCHFQAHC